MRARAHAPGSWRDRSSPRCGSSSTREKRTTSPRCNASTVQGNLSTLSRTGGSGSIPGAVHDMRTPGVSSNEFVERAAIDPQERADLLEPALERRLDLTGRDVNQPGGQVREEPLELQALLEREVGPAPCGAAQEPHHEQRAGDDQHHRRGDEHRVSVQIQIASPLFSAEIATDPGQGVGPRELRPMVPPIVCLHFPGLGEGTAMRWSGPLARISHQAAGEAARARESAKQRC